MIDDDFVEFLEADSAVAAITTDISVGEVPASDDGIPYLDTYVWISQYDENDTLDLTGTSGLTEFRFDVECCAENELTAKQLARAVKKRCQAHKGTMGDTTVQGIFVESQDENYEAINRFRETQMTVVAMDITIFTDDAANDL